jgi:hypothetical protein
MGQAIRGWCKSWAVFFRRLFGPSVGDPMIRKFEPKPGERPMKGLPAEV